eukprot:4633350-Pleurochrysis_carterae.AAC.2
MFTNKAVHCTNVCIVFLSALVCAPVWLESCIFVLLPTQALIDALDRCPVLRSLELAPNPATEQKANYTLTLIKSFPSLVAGACSFAQTAHWALPSNFFVACHAQVGGP